VKKASPNDKKFVKDKNNTSGTSKNLIVAVLG
jgi:hypothetical protein